VVVKAGRYGPYVSHDGVNATLPKDKTPETITLEEALPLLAARAEHIGNGGGRPARRGRAAKPAAKGADKPVKERAAKPEAPKPAKAGAGKSAKPTTPPAKSARPTAKIPAKNSPAPKIPAKRAKGGK
jgi:DNA topoisomerase-1